MPRTRNGNTGTRARPRTTWRERAFVLGGFAVAVPCTAWSAATGAGLEPVAAAWLAACVWAFLSSLALALRCAFRDGDWSAFGRVEPFDNTDTIDWSTKSGAYAYLRIQEEHERLMRRD